MITIPKKFCNKVNCNNLIDFTEKFCKKHEELNYEYDRKRYKEDKEIRKTYSNKTWKNIRKNVLIRDDYLCQYCLANSHVVRAEVVDHYIPVRDAYENRYDENNLVASCIKCNTKKSYDEDKLRNNQITLEEYKSRWRYDTE